MIQLWHHIKFYLNVTYPLACKLHLQFLFQVCHRVFIQPRLCQCFTHQDVTNVILMLFKRCSCHFQQPSNHTTSATTNHRDRGRDAYEPSYDNQWSSKFYTGFLRSLFLYIYVTKFHSYCTLICHAICVDQK